MLKAISLRRESASQWRLSATRFTCLEDVIRSIRSLMSFYVFDSRSSVWSRIESVAGPPPRHRSYHLMTADERFVYVFGGCGVAGRLNDLTAFDTVEKEWVRFPEAGEGCLVRGGPGLVFSAQKLWVVYGFAGKEMDDVHCFDPTRKEWTQVETKGEKPSARSVFSSAVIGKYIFVYGGEIDPSDQGHLGAGMLSGDVHALDTETLEWKKCRDVEGSGDHPGPRGWCAFAAEKRGGTEGLLVYGGNSPSNDRLDDMFFFTPVFDLRCTDTAYWSPFPCRTRRDTARHRDTATRQAEKAKLVLKIAPEALDSRFRRLLHTRRRTEVEKKRIANPKQK